MTDMSQLGTNSGADMAGRITTVRAARILDMGERQVQLMHDNGTLTDVIMTPLGRLFSRAEVEALRDKRASGPSVR